MPATPTPTIREFLAKYVEAYLLEDVARLLEIQPAEGRVTGACGYPLVMTVCSGIELLGALCSPKKLNFKEKGFAQRNFVRYWRNRMYRSHQHLRRAGPGMYALVRNGVAHSFLKKGPIVVVKGRHGDESVTAVPGRRRQVIINATQLAADFVTSFNAVKAAMPPATERSMQKRLDELWREYMDTAWGTPPQMPGHKGRRRNLNFFAGLKPPSPFVAADAAATGSDAPVAAADGGGAAPASPAAPIVPSPTAGSGQGVVYTHQQPGAAPAVIPTVFKTN